MTTRRGFCVFTAPMPDGTYRRYHGHGAYALISLIRIWNRERAEMKKALEAANA